MLLFDSLRFALTMSHISALALIGILLILKVESEELNTTSGIPLCSTEYPDTEYPDTEYPDTEYTDTEYPDNEYPDTEYPDTDFVKGMKKGVPYIAGGSPSAVGEFPFMAALGWINEAGELNYHGGGVLISKKMVLTAAHCAYKNGKLPDIIFIGGNLLLEYNKYENLFSKFSVANVEIFPEYDPNQGYHDIAILELNERTWYPPICLWTSPNLNNDEVTAIGYGLTEFAGSGSQQLLKVNLTTFSIDYCAPFFKRQRKFKSGLSDSHICAGDKQGIKDTCQGDSGGPLITMHDNKMFAVGITSSGQACSGFPPAIYTKIYPYTEWITSVLKEQGESLRNCTTQENGMN